MNGLSLIKKAAGYAGGMGVKATLVKLRMRIRTDRMYKKARVMPHTKADIAAQRSARLPGAGTILVNADVRGMDDAFVRQLIDSMLAQTYDNWQLCLVGGDAGAGFADARIRAAQAACEDGEYIAVLARGCTLHPCALYDAMQAFAQQGADFVYTDEIDENGRGLYKPDYGPDTLRSINYIGGFMAVKGGALRAAGGLGGGAHELALRLAQKAERIVHVPQALCTRHAPLEECARVRRARCEIQKPGLVSILIPNKDHAQDLLRCVNSLREKTAYPDWEIIIIENNSVEPQTFACYEELKKDPRIRVAVWEKGFNYAAINNFGETLARGEYLLLLNNDVEVISPNWMEEMLLFAQREDVGAVGAMLYYPDDTVQHAGVIVGVGDVAGHAFRGCRRGEGGYMNMLYAARNVSAVTAACLMMRRDVYRRIGGMDEGYAVAYNDVDMCMRIREAGLVIVFTPYAELYHYESRSRGLDTTAQKFLRYDSEATRFHKRWREIMEKGDPYHNGNLSKRREDFGV